MRVGVGLSDRRHQEAESGRIEPVVVGRIVEGDRGARAVDSQKNGVGHDPGKIPDPVAKSDRARHIAVWRKSYDLYGPARRYAFRAARSSRPGARGGPAGL